jgi:hypothetical protein
MEWGDGPGCCEEQDWEEREGEVDIEAEDGVHVEAGLTFAELTVVWPYEEV